MTTTIPSELHEKAITAVRGTDPCDEQRRIRAVKALRDAHAGTYVPLPELVAAVDWALAQEGDPAQHLVAYDPDHGRAQFAFPNGHSATVIPDPRTPLRFEVFSSDPADPGHVVFGLTTEQAEAKLVAVAALPEA